MSFITRFFSSSSLTEEINVQIPSETTEISPKRFFNQTNLETVDFLGNQANKIGHRAFYGCSKLRSITLEKCIYLQTIESEALAIIPTEWKSEVMCWEFEGNIDGLDFIVYVNCETGKEEDILIITNTPNGTLTH